MYSPFPGILNPLRIHVRIEMREGRFRNGYCWRDCSYRFFTRAIGFLRRNRWSPPLPADFPRSTGGSTEEPFDLLPRRLRFTRSQLRVSERILFFLALVRYYTRGVGGTRSCNGTRPTFVISSDAFLLLTDRCTLYPPPLFGIRGFTMNRGWVEL